MNSTATVTTDRVVIELMVGRRNLFHRCKQYLFVVVLALAESTLITHHEEAPDLACEKKGIDLGVIIKGTTFVSSNRATLNVTLSVGQSGVTLLF